MATREQKDNGMDDPRQDNKIVTGRWDHKVGPDNKRAVESIVKACYIRI